MMQLPLEPRAIVGLVRGARRPMGAPRPIHVSGPLARELVAALAAGGRPGLVQLGSGESAAVLVRVLTGAPGAEDVDILRRATRALVPVVAVQTAPWDGPVPYLGASEIVLVPAGSGFPVEQIAKAIVAAAGEDAVELAAGLPLLAGPARASCITRAAAAAAVVAGTPIGGDVHLPAIVAAQTRMLGALRRLRGGDLGDADNQALARVVGPEIVAPIAAGIAARGLVRRLPRGGPPLRAAVAAGVTIALGVLASRLGDRLPSA